MLRISRPNYLLAKTLQFSVFRRLLSSADSFVPQAGISFSNGVPRVHPDYKNHVYACQTAKSCSVVLASPSVENDINFDGAKLGYDRSIEFEANDRLGTLTLMSAKSDTFCSASDFRQVQEGERKDAELQEIRDVIKQKYEFYNQIHMSDIPVVSIINGDVSRSGIGFAFATKFPVTTERTQFSVSRTVGHLWPDAGSSKWLSDLKGVGMYLALTGLVLKGTDLIDYGISRYYMPSGGVEAFVHDLCTDHSRNYRRVEEHVMSSCQEVDAPSSRIINKLSHISALFDPCFDGKDTPLTLLHRLSSDHSPLADRILSRIISSPALPLCLTFHAIREAESLSFRGCLKRDYSLSYNLCDPSFVATILSKSKIPVPPNSPIGSNWNYVLSPSLFDVIPFLSEPTHASAKISLKKAVIYNIPQFRGQNRLPEGKHAYEQRHKYTHDWERVYLDMNEMEEVGAIEPFSTAPTSNKSYIHPRTGLIMPVNMEWEDDMFGQVQEDIHYSNHLSEEHERDMGLIMGVGEAAAEDIKEFVKTDVESLRDSAIRRTKDKWQEHKELEARTREVNGNPELNSESILKTLKMVKEVDSDCLNPCKETIEKSTSSSTWGSPFYIDSLLALTGQELLGDSSMQSKSAFKSNNPVKPTELSPENTIGGLMESISFPEDVMNSSSSKGDGWKHTISQLSDEEILVLGETMRERKKYLKSVRSHEHVMNDDCPLHDSRLEDDLLTEQWEELDQVLVDVPKKVDSNGKPLGNVPLYWSLNDDSDGPMTWGIDSHTVSQIRYKHTRMN